MKIFAGFLFLAMLLTGSWAQKETSNKEVEKIMKQISKTFYDPFEQGVLEFSNVVEFSIEKPFPVMVSGWTHQKKEGEGEFKITQIEPQELEPFIKPFEKQFIKQIERITLPNFVELFRNFDLKILEQEKERIILVGKAKNGESRAIKIFLKDLSIERIELLIVIANPKEPEEPRKFQTTQDFVYKMFEGVKVIDTMTISTELGEVVARFEYTKVEGYIFPREVLTKIGPVETSYLYKNYELVVDTGEF